MTTVPEIASWFDRGVADGASHMIVAVDRFDHENYPVYVGEPTKVRGEVERIEGGSMQGVMEVYDLHADKLAQMLERRAWRVPA